MRDDEENDAPPEGKVIRLDANKKKNRPARSPTLSRAPGANRKSSAKTPSTSPFKGRIAIVIQVLALALVFVVLMKGCHH